MTPVNDFSLQVAVGRDQAPSSSHLVYRGRPTGIRVSGCVLERQFACAAGYLLMTTDDSPFEEALHVQLVSREIRFLDCLDLSHPYAAAILRDVKAVSPNQVNFSFFGGDTWKLTVLDRPRYVLPINLFSPVKRRWGRPLFRSYLELSRANSV